MSRRAAIVVCGCLLALLAITARAAAELFASADPHPFDDGHRRVVGRGQIAFDGAGPERWAMRWRRQRRLVLQLRNELLAYRRPRKAVCFRTMRAGCASIAVRAPGGRRPGTATTAASRCRTAGRAGSPTPRCCHRRRRSPRPTPRPASTATPTAGCRASGLTRSRRAPGCSGERGRVVVVLAFLLAAALIWRMR